MHGAASPGCSSSGSTSLPQPLFSRHSAGSQRMVLSLSGSTWSSTNDKGSTSLGFWPMGSKMVFVESREFHEKMSIQIIRSNGKWIHQHELYVACIQLKEHAASKVPLETAVTLKQLAIAGRPSRHLNFQKHLTSGSSLSEREPERLYPGWSTDCSTASWCDERQMDLSCADPLASG